MNRESIFKLRAGNTLYIVSLERGAVYEMYVRSVEDMDGYPLVGGDSRMILERGLTVTDYETVKNYGCWFCPDEAFEDDMFRQTRSRKQALRWAKEGFDLYGEPMWASGHIKIVHPGSETL